MAIDRGGGGWGPSREGAGGRGRGGPPGSCPGGVCRAHGGGGRGRVAVLGPNAIMPPNSWQVVEELGMFGHDLDSQAFSSPAPDVKRLELAALYTLQHGLSGDADPQPRFEHRQILWRRLFDEARAQLVGHPDAPRRAWGELFADDDPGDQPAVQRGRRPTADRGRR